MILNYRWIEMVSRLPDWMMPRMACVSERDSVI